MVSLACGIFFWQYWDLNSGLHTCYQLSYFPIPMWNLLKVNLIDAECRMVVVSVYGVEKKEDIGQSVQILL
jgi:hypothetical protein